MTTKTDTRQYFTTVSHLGRPNRFSIVDEVILGPVSILEFANVSREDIERMVREQLEFVSQPTADALGDIDHGYEVVELDFNQIVSTLIEMRDEAISA